jgi:hypothetical protein
MCRRIRLGQMFAERTGFIDLGESSTCLVSLPQATYTLFKGGMMIASATISRMSKRGSLRYFDLEFLATHE